MIELAQMALIFASGLVTAIILVLPFKFLLSDGPHNEFVALAWTLYVVFAVVAMCLVCCGVARLLRVGR